MPIFWINTWEHVSKRCILPLLGLLLNWALTALKWEPNESECPHFWALRYVYLSSPNQPPPVDVSGTTAALVQGCSGKWNPAQRSVHGRAHHALSAALMEELIMLWVQRDDRAIAADRTTSEKDSLPGFRMQSGSGLLCFPLKSRTRLSKFTFTFHFHALEKEMATHSSILAWRIPGTAEPGGLPSTGSHRVGHDWSDLAAAAVLYDLFLFWGLRMSKSVTMLLFKQMTGW